MVTAPRGPTKSSPVWPVEAADGRNLSDPVDAVFASLTDDQGEEARRYAEFVLRVQARAAAADAPRTADLQPAREALEAKGYTWTLTEVVATAYGDTTARRRVVALAWRSDVPPARREVYNLTKDLVFPEGTPCAHIMVPAAKVCTEWWLTPDQGVLTLDPRMPRRGGPLDAIPVGHFCGNASKTNEVVYSGRGPLPSLRTGAWLRNPGTRVLIHQPEGQGTCVRPLLPVEAWRAHGGEAGPWTKCINAETEAGSGKNTMERLLDTGGEQHTLALWALRASPPGMADAIVRTTLAALAEENQGRAGVCPLPEEARVWDRMQRWMWAWRRNPERPSEALAAASTPAPAETNQLARLRAMDLENCDPVKPSPYAHTGQASLHALSSAAVIGYLTYHDFFLTWAQTFAALGATWSCSWWWSGLGAVEVDRRCGAKQRGWAPEALVKLAHLHGPLGAQDRHGLHPTAAPLATRADLEEEKVRLVLGKLAESSRRAYSVGWRWWALFCRARNIEPLRRVKDDNRDEEEDRILDFVVHLATNGRMSPGTIKMYLSAVRSHHVAAGRPDLTAGMARLWMAMDGLKRMYGAPSRKRPVTVQMLRHARARLQPDSSADGAMVWAALLLAFFFLLRASEYCASNSAGTDVGKGVRGMDLTFKRQGKEVLPSESPDELILCIRGSKTDQYNRGEFRNHFRTGDKEVCVVAAVAGYAAANMERVTGLQASRPLFVDSQGRLLQRDRIQQAIEQAAADVGTDIKHVGTHSLRIGGASALWNTFRDTALVQRWGRWVSSAFQGYLWDARGLAEGVSSRMLAADFDLT